MTVIVKCTERELAKAWAFDSMTAYIKDTFYTNRQSPIIEQIYNDIIAHHAMLLHNLPKD